ncbi:MAG: hypothetical protein RML93_13805 [Anaerolineales bacterium]|nr:hypothetical protein [Anaerolineales bacterium]MDW8448349.1 hypothetical protein [Anaerolineales bacterium]
MKTSSWPSYLFLFVLFFPIGFWAGTRISVAYPSLRSALLRLLPFQASPEPAYPLPNKIDQPSGTPVPSLVTPAQTNFLLLFVNDLSAPHPQLTSAWLLVHPHDSLRLIFLPIFQEHNPDEELVTSFQIEGRSLSEEFLAAIEKRNLLWHSFLVLDHLAQATILTDAQDNETLLSSVYLRRLCETLPWQPQILGKFKTLIPEHLNSDLDLLNSIELWQLRLERSPNLTCEFPTLSR